MKTLSLEEIGRLNQLLDESLSEANKEQLATCIKLLGTSLAQLKIQYQIDENRNAQTFSGFVKNLEQNTINQEVSELAAKTIVECATAMAVAKGALDNTEGKINS